MAIALRRRAPVLHATNQILDKAQFDHYVESLWQRFYADDVRRAVPARWLHRDESPAPNRAVVRFYNKRGTAEQWIKEWKQAAHWTRLGLFGAMLQRIWAPPVPAG